MLTLERRRAERSRKPFVLMLLDANLENGTAEEILRQAVDIVVASKRETDLVGWYKQGAILGVIFTEVNLEGELTETAPLEDRDRVHQAFGPGPRGQDRHFRACLPGKLGQGQLRLGGGFQALP